MPDLNDLDHFDEGIPVTPLPASEVRRRGERMRRRNTVLATVGGVAAAAVFIGTPVAVLAGQDGDDVQPALPSGTTDGTSEGVAWVQEVPERFPLTTDFPRVNGSDGSPVEVTRVDALPALSLCQKDAWAAAAPVDVAHAEYTGESEDTASRSLALFADDTTAEAALTAVREAVAGCAEEELELATMTNRLEDVDLGTESSLVLSQQVVEQDQTISGLFLTEIARTGNALFVNSFYGSAGGDQTIAFEVERMREQAGAVLALMCMFSAEPCDVTGIETTGPTSEAPSPGPPSQALADFPLDEGYPETNEDGSPVEITAEPGVGMIELCDSIAWDPYGGTTDLIGVEFGGPEDFRGRTLAIFRTEAQAVAALDNAADALTACPEEASDDESGASSVYEAFDVDLGYDTVVWTQRYRTPEGRFDTGLTVYQVARVGKAIYVSFEYGEAGGSADSIRLAVLAATAAAEPIVEAMRAL